MTLICLIFIVASERNTYQANTPVDNAESRRGNIDYANELEDLMARVAVLILTDALSSLPLIHFCPLFPNIFGKKSNLGAVLSC